MAVRSAHLHDAGSGVAGIGLLRAAALLAAVLRRDFHRSLPRALAAAARRRALAPRRPRAEHARDRAVRCVVQRRALAAVQRRRCDDRARARLPAGGGGALRPAAPRAGGAVDLQAAPYRKVPPVPRRRCAIGGGLALRSAARCVMGGSARAACTEYARDGGWSPRAPRALIGSGPTHRNRRVERALVFSKFSRSLPAQPMARHVCGRVGIAEYVRVCKYNRGRNQYVASTSATRDGAPH